MKRLFTLCVTGRYLYLDLSLLFDCPEGVDDVATFVEDGNIICLFNWKFPSPWNMPKTVTSDPEREWFAKIVELPYEPWWGELYKEGAKRNAEYRNRLRVAEIRA